MQSIYWDLTRRRACDSPDKIHILIAVDGRTPIPFQNIIRKHLPKSNMAPIDVNESFMGCFGCDNDLRMKTDYESHKGTSAVFEYKGLGRNRESKLVLFVNLT